MKSRRVAAFAVTMLASTAFAIGPVATTSAFAKPPPKPHPTPTNTHKPDYPPSHGHHASVTPNKAKAANQPVSVTYTADGYNPGEKVDIYLNGIYQTTLTADSNGVVVYNTTFDRDLKHDYKFTSIGEDSNVKDEANFHLSAFVIPTTTKSSGSSGEEMGTAIGLAALAMLSVGSGSIYTMRRRRKAAHA